MVEETAHDWLKLAEEPSEINENSRSMNKKSWLTERFSEKAQNRKKNKNLSL